jgi:hypothetical protein
VIRTLHPELLDTLPAHDASAIGSRRDLRRLNTLMSHAPIIARALKKIFPTAPPASIVEIGAGDGQLLLRVAQRMNSSGCIKPDNYRPSQGATQLHPLPKGEGWGEGEQTSITPTSSNQQLDSVLSRNDADEKGSAPASGAVSRASRLTRARDTRPPFCILPHARVRCEAHRTAAGAAALPKKTVVHRTTSTPLYFPGNALSPMCFPQHSFGCN